MIVSRERAVFKDAADLGKHLRKLLKKEGSLAREREHFWIIILKTKGRIKFVELIGLGTKDACLIHPREVYRWAIKHGVSALILGHNHPSGDCRPSKDDISLTKRLIKAGEIIGIEILDHVVIGDNTLSFKEEGLM